jgi:hypothetical protein
MYVGKNFLKFDLMHMVFHDMYIYVIILSNIINIHIYSYIHIYAYAYR